MRCVVCLWFVGCRIVCVCVCCAVLACCLDLAIKKEEGEEEGKSDTILLLARISNIDSLYTRHIPNPSPIHHVREVHSPKKHEDVHPHFRREVCQFPLLLCASGSSNKRAQNVCGPSTKVCVCAGGPVGEKVSAQQRGESFPCLSPDTVCVLRL